jgi:D-alanyl-D-alanine dipeptidase
MLHEIFSWVTQLFGGNDDNARKPWKAFAALHDSARLPVPLDALVDMAAYRKEERTAACNGTDPIEVFVAYAQDKYVYDGNNRIAPVDDVYYRMSTDDDKVNKFTQTYRQGAKLLLHKALADIAVDAAIDLHTHQSWKLRLYDGLRTVEAAFLLYHNAKPEWLQAGLLAAPGASAHNRGLAVDSKLVDSAGREIEEGGHFDHLDMETNRRDYAGSGISAQAKENRLTRERAFQRASLKHGTLIAPLKSEFWDDRMPGSEKDLWRVMESVARCIGTPAPSQKAEDYATFRAQWKSLDQEKLAQMLGTQTPPPEKNFLFHERFNPIYDRYLPEPLRIGLLDPARLPSQSMGR